jgi:hypothetical protein
MKVCSQVEQMFLHSNYVCKIAAHPRAHFAMFYKSYCALALVVSNGNFQGPNPSFCNNEMGIIFSIFLEAAITISKNYVGMKCSIKDVDMYKLCSSRRFNPHSQTHCTDKKGSEIFRIYKDGICCKFLYEEGLPNI